MLENNKIQDLKKFNRYYSKCYVVKPLRLRMEIDENRRVFYDLNGLTTKYLFIVFLFTSTILLLCVAFISLAKHLISN